MEKDKNEIREIVSLWHSSWFRIPYFIGTICLLILYQCANYYIVPPSNLGIWQELSKSLYIKFGLACISISAISSFLCIFFSQMWLQTILAKIASTIDNFKIHPIGFYNPKAYDSAIRITTKFSKLFAKVMISCFLIGLCIIIIRMLTNNGWIFIAFTLGVFIISLWLYNYYNIAKNG